MRASRRTSIALGLGGEASILAPDVLFHDAFRCPGPRELPELRPYPAKSGDKGLLNRCGLARAAPGKVPEGG